MYFPIENNNNIINIYNIIIIKEFYNVKTT